MSKEWKLRKGERGYDVLLLDGTRIGYVAQGAVGGGASTWFATPAKGASLLARYPTRADAAAALYARARSAEN